MHILLQYCYLWMSILDSEVAQIGSDKNEYRNLIALRSGNIDVMVVKAEIKTKPDIYGNAD